MTNSKFIFAALGLFLILGINGCSSIKDGKTADAIFYNAKIYTLDDSSPWVNAMAIKNGKIIAVGSSEDVMKAKGNETALHDLDGKMLMPGIHDIHLHMQEAVMPGLYECVTKTGSLDELLSMVKKCVSEHKKEEIVLAGPWTHDMLSAIPKGTSPKELLDKISPDNPVYITQNTEHGGWANSKALELLNIDKTTPNPSGGEIQKDKKTGEPTGILIDNAFYGTITKVTNYSSDQYEKMINKAIGILVSHGVTSARDAITLPPVIPALVKMDKANQLKVRMHSSITWKFPESGSHQTELDAIIKYKDYNSDFLNFFTKIVLDGIPATETSALIDPYMASKAHGSNYRGKLSITPEDLMKDIPYIDSLGMTLKVHALGDRSVRAVLDGIEQARKVNGNSGIRHEIAHPYIVKEEDFKRFKELNVTADLSPIFYYPAARGSIEPALGKERTDNWGQFKKLHDLGVLLAYGSDWPVVAEPNPWLALEALVTRADPTGKSKEVGNINQAVDLKTAVTFFTINGAITNRTGERSGSLEVGKDADFIILNQNIFEAPIEDVSETKVLKTIVNGEVVYEAKK